MLDRNNSLLELPDEILANNVRNMREVRSFTQTLLAKKAGVSHTMIVRIEQKTLWPKAASLAKIANALGITVSGLFMSQNDWHPDTENALRIIASELGYQLPDTIKTMPKEKK